MSVLAVADPTIARPAPVRPVRPGRPRGAHRHVVPSAQPPADGTSTADVVPIGAAAPAQDALGSPVQDATAALARDGALALVEDAVVSPGPDAAVAPVTVTISIDAGGAAWRDEVLDAVRDLVQAVGSLATIAVAPGAGAGAGVAGLVAIPVGSGAAAGSAPAAISIDPRPRTVDQGGWPLHLSRLEYDLLLFLAEHPRQVFSRSQLLAQVWGHTHTTVRTVDVHISRLRSKVGDQELITTVYGLGYRLADDAAITVVAR
jgi:hypothetical protein